MALLPLSTAYTRLFLIVQSADHITGLTGAAPTVTISKAGAAFGAAGGAVSELTSGWYKIVLTTTDTNTAGDLAFHCVATVGSGDPTDFVDQVGLIGGLLNDGTATVNLTKLNVVNSAGSAIVATSSGGNGSGLDCTGQGSGHGIKGIGGSTSGSGIHAGGGVDGISATGVGVGAGMTLQGGATNGPGLYAAAGGGDAAGFQADSAGASAGALFNGGTTGIGLHVRGGTAGGAGMYCQARGTGDTGFATQGGPTSGRGAQFNGAGTGSGAEFNGAGSGSGAVFNGGTSGDGADFFGNGNGTAGIYVFSAGNPGYGLFCDHTGTGTGIVGTLDSATTVDSIFDRADAIETGMTLRQALRGTTSKLFGKVSGGSTGTELFRAAVSDSKTRITFTDDINGNRTAVVTDLT